MPDWKIRIAGPADIHDVLGADVFDGPAEAVATERFLGAPCASDRQDILALAELEGRIVGFASGTVLDHPDKPRALFVQELGVNEEARRRGIARALVEVIRAQGRARGCSATWVLTDEDNHAARATYAASGGVETTGVVMYEWDEGADAARAREPANRRGA